MGRWRPYSLGMTRSAILECTCLDGTRTFDSLGRLVMVEGGEEEGNVLAFCAVLRGELKVGFLATRAIQQEERVMCTEV